MQPHDVVLALNDLFPRQREELKGRASVYKQVLTPLAGDRLSRAYERTMANWTKAAAPWPKDIADNAPDRTTGATNRVETTERALEIQRRLITDTLHWLSFEIAATAKDHGINHVELEGRLDWLWRKPAWDLARAHVLRGADLPQRMPVAQGELEAVAQGIEAAGTAGYKRAGTFKPLRAPALGVDARESGAEGREDAQHMMAQNG